MEIERQFWVEKLPQLPDTYEELHVHGGHLAGFSYVEVEFSTVEKAKGFVPPDWFGRKVTEDARFSYGTLANEDGMEVVRRLLIDR